MALGASYASIAALEGRLGPDDGTFSQKLNAASRAVEAFTRRQFNKEDVASERRFRAVDPSRLPVDDFHTLTDLAVEVDGTAWDLADVDPRPPNGVVNGQVGWPFSDILAVRRSWPHDRRATVTVTAQWGWAAVPKAIVEATLDVAEAMSSGGGAIRSETMGTYSVSYDVGSSAAATSAFDRAAPYRRKIWGVA